MIRPATLNDAERITEFNALMAKETENIELDLTRLRAGVESVLRDKSKGVYYIAEENGSALGQTLITYEWSDWRNGMFWWIQSVYVQKDYRGKGVFKAMFEHLRTLAKQEQTVCGLRLYVEEHNSRAQQTYERLGMKKTYYDMYELDFVLL
ncbi:MAG: GNAT family N-acetyltransferase [Ignavibacteriae bacterium]|nr:GNAT family N-acetyltransferase [Ignavibacteriota bacterium]